MCNCGAGLMSEPATDASATVEADVVWQQLSFRSLLEAYDVGGLQTLGALHHFELYRRASFQALVPLPLNGRLVNEHVLPLRPFDEAEALVGVKPLHCSLFFGSFAQLCAP